MKRKFKKVPNYIKLTYVRIYNNKVCLSTAQGEPDFCRKIKLFGYK